MVLIGIPVYHARETLPKLLDSLVAQTKKMFAVCISVDCDGEDYQDIVEEYNKRGLNIFSIYSDINRGPGIARQRIIDINTMYDYVIFCDADDMLMPRAIEVLYREAKKGNYDVLASSFIREDYDGSGYNMDPEKTPCTWCHGKIYKTSYLKENNIRFLEDAPLNEDAYFNLVAWNGARAKGYTKETTYLWRYNKNSLTRKENQEKTFIKSSELYIYTQVKGLIKLYSIAPIENDLSPLISDTILNIYYHAMRMKYLNMDDTKYKEYLKELGSQKFIQDFLMDGDNWIYMGRKVNSADKYDDVIYFYKMPLDAFIMEYIYSPTQEKLLVEGEEKWALK